MNEKKDETKQEIFDESYPFQIRIRRLLKNLANDPSMRIVLSARRNIGKSASRQIEYILEITDDKNLHSYNIDDLIKGGYAVPAAPDYPEVEEEQDSTNILANTDLP